MNQTLTCTQIPLAINTPCRNCSKSHPHYLLHTSTTPSSYSTYFISFPNLTSHIFNIPSNPKIPNSMSMCSSSLPITLLFLMILYSATAKAATTYNVVKFGAKPDGHTDSTKAFLSAWAKACASHKPTTINVPQGRFLLGSAAFRGKCNNK